MNEASFAQATTTGVPASVDRANWRAVGGTVPAVPRKEMLAR